MTPRRALLANALLLPLWLSATASARAESAEANAAIERGVELRRGHRDAQALSEFRRAYATEGTPRALAQVALAEAALGQWVAAESDLVRALAADDPWIERQRRALRLALDEVEAHLGTLEVSGPVGGQVWIDGVLVARLPCPFLRVVAGHLVVELVDPGFEPARIERDVGPGLTVRADFSPEPAVLVPDWPRVEPHARATREPSRTAAGAWIAGGASLVALGTGVALTLFASDRAAHYNDDVCGDQPGLPRSVRCAGDASDAHAAQIGAWVAYGLAGAAAVTSTFLFVLRRDRPTGSAAVSLLPAPGGAAFGVDF